MTRRVYFLGAGFSKALNPLYPTLAELSQIVGRNLRLRHSSGAIRAHLDQLPAQLEADFEQLLSYLYSDWPWKTSGDRHLDMALYEALVYEIWNALSSIQLSSISEEHREFIQFLRAIDDNSVISVNYDNLVEEYKSNNKSARDTNHHLGGLTLRIEERFEPSRRTSKQTPWILENVSISGQPPQKFTCAREWLSTVSFKEFSSVFIAFGKDNPSGRAWANESALKHLFDALNKKEDPYPTKRFAAHAGKTLHLHGSLHWSFDSTNPTIRVTNDQGINRLERIPAIVPPVMDKSRHYANTGLALVWNSAHEAIREAQEIVIVGFSFPPTDISCQFLFKSAIQPGVRVVTVNRDPSIAERYQAVFGSVPNVKLDFSFLGGEDPLTRYIQSEVLKELS